MKRFLVVSIMTMTLGVLSARGWAADAPQGKKEVPFLKTEPFDDSKWQKSLTDIRQRTDQLTKENEKLNDEHKSMSADLEKTQTSLQSTQKQNEDTADKVKETRTFLTEQKDKVKSIEDDIDKLNRDLAELEDQNASLEEDFSTTGESQKLWKLKSAELKAQKSSVDLDNTLEESLNPQMKKTLQEINELEEKLSDSKREEAQLDSMIQDEAGGISDLKDNAETLKAENAKLMLEANDLEKKKSLSAKMKPEQKKEGEAADRAADKEYLEKMKEKKDLQESITNLEAQIEDVEKSIDGISQVQFKKRHLLDQIMSLDAENQTLRNEISALKKNLKGLAKESEANEAPAENAPVKAVTPAAPTTTTPTPPAPKVEKP